MVGLIQTQSLGMPGLTPTLAGLTLELLTLANARAIPLLEDLSLCAFVPLWQDTPARVYASVSCQMIFQILLAKGKPTEHISSLSVMLCFTRLHSFPSGSFPLQTSGFYCWPSLTGEQNWQLFPSKHNFPNLKVTSAA